LTGNRVHKAAGSSEASSVFSETYMDIGYHSNVAGMAITASRSIGSRPARRWYPGSVNLCAPNWRGLAQNGVKGTRWVLCFQGLICAGIEAIVDVRCKAGS
jgi:hypothetical protein